VLSDLGLACLHCGRLPEAVGWLRRSLALRPGFARVSLHLGRALEQIGDADGALAAYRRAIALEPKPAEAHRREAELLQAKGRRREAAESFDRAALAADDQNFAGVCRARALIARGRPAAAQEWLERLIARDPSSGEAHRLLGNLLAESGDFDAAAAHFERAIAVDPSEVGAYHGLAMSRRLTAADRPLVARLRARLAGSDIADPDRMRLLFALGKALDDLGDRAAAMRQFDAANRIRHRFCRFDRSELARRVDALIARFDRELFVGAPLRGDDELPVLVLGMPRSGTTLVERIVASHARVKGGGEIEFWTEHAPALVRADRAGLAAAAERLHADYRRLLRGIGRDALRVTDKMPFNFLWLGLIHLIFPNARVIHCRRHPVDTCLSIYTNDFGTRWEFAGDRGDLAFYYRQYLRLMDHWRRVLPPERLLEIEYEDVASDPAGSAQRLIAFCGLEWDPACLRPERNPDAVKTASLWQARQPVHRRSVDRWRNYEPWLGELRQLMPR
jgi:Flp pilus assembly protein TadD